jgi:hypothetical protein
MVRIFDLEKTLMLCQRDLSLFSPQMLTEKQHRGLLLQFLLSALFDAVKSVERGEDLKELFSASPHFIPYDWAKPIGHLNKLQEHGLLLKSGFPEERKALSDFEKKLSKLLSLCAKKIEKIPFQKEIRSLYLTLEPFLKKCREDENLTFFLLKHKSDIDQIIGQNHLHSFLENLYPEGLEILGEKVCDRYHQRGFFSQISEFKLLLAEI